MNLYLKNTALLFCIVLVVVIGRCKKDKAQSQREDFRDSLVGNYNCIEHYYSHMNGNSIDSIIGPVNVTVSKAADDSSILINGQSWRYSFPYCDSTRYAFGFFPVNAYIVKRNDSIWFLTNFQANSWSQSDYYYTGRKQ